MPEVKQYNVVVGNDLITIETGKIANLANGSVTIRQGDTLLLVTATMSKNPPPNLDYFPLSVEYEERIYAVGKIPGSFFRREGRPSEAAILVGRLTDRPLRPLFPDNFFNEVQIVSTVLSVDELVQPDILSIIGASAALTISDIPFGAPPYDGPVGAVRIGLIDDQFVVNPTFPQMEQSTLNLRVAGTRDAILMVECGANEVPEETIEAALVFAHQAMQPLIDVQELMAQEIGKPKIVVPAKADDSELRAAVQALALDKVANALRTTTSKEMRSAALDAITATVLEAYAEKTDVAPAKLKELVEDLVKVEVRRQIVIEGRRPDGRTVTQIRPLAAETGFSPRVHGSGLFTRGETQVLSIATLGTPRDAQELDSLVPGISNKRYMHHYNFPPFSVGEVGRVGSPKRREIGHGALAEQAIVPVLPDPDTFPYTLRVVSEVLSSNGSTSMASVCGSTLALMDAGVPIRKPVGGIAMGLVMDGAQYAILTDIQGMEDHLGDMDFKVAGTVDGVTALQMDIKVKGITSAIMGIALTQAKQARLEILKTITDHLAKPRSELSPRAPRMISVQINPDKIGALIGPGGKNIRAIQENYNVKIEVENDGKVLIYSDNAAGMREAESEISKLGAVVEEGAIYTGKVVRIEAFGAFVELLPGTDGLVHISQLADYRVNTVEEVAKLGDELTVMVIGIDPATGKIRLSRQAVLQGWTLEEARDSDRKKPAGGGGGNRGGREGGNRGGGREGGHGGGGFRGGR